MSERGVRQIPAREVARRPLPGGSFPVGVSFSPNGRVITFLHDPAGGLERELFVLDLAAPSPESRRIAIGGDRVREEELDLEEELRRQRNRELGLGITSAVWAADADALLVPLPDGLFILRGLSENGEPDVELVPHEKEMPAMVGPKISPDGLQIAFVRAGRLCVRDTAAGSAARPLTPVPEEGISYGLAEYVAQEEMDRPDGFFWSKDSRFLAYAIVDEREVPPYRIAHQGSDDPLAAELHRYPFAGRVNASVRLAVVSVDKGEPVELERGEEDEYLVAVHWLADGRVLGFFENRAQTRLEVASFTPPEWTRRVLFVEEKEPYLNLQDDFRQLTGGAFLRTSERTGFRHLELRDSEGKFVRFLTDGEWQVDALEGVDEAGAVAYVSATADGPTERHLYEVPLEGGGLRRLTPEAGTHDVVLAEGGGVFVDRRSSLAEPPIVTVRSVEDGRPVATLHETRDPRIDELGLAPPELVSLRGPDGSELFGLVFPAVSAESVPPPLAVQVYGGPHAQLATNSWASTTMLRAQALARLGITVLVLDNRGSARRGLSFESALWRRMGEVEVEDQVAGVHWAVETGRADPDRVAVFGWSYGGYMALRCLALGKGTFRAAVAGAPVTDWDGYDTYYTERYMGHPDGNRDGYDRSSVLSWVGEIEGDLLLVHGLLDENVHFRHTARLLERLIDEERPHRLLCFPGERHMPRHERDRAFLEREVIGWISEKLGGRPQAEADTSSKAAPA